MDHRRREEFPVIFLELTTMRELSVFIDESGDFGETRDEKRLSKGEQQFFYKPNELKKTFIKGISKKRI